jgi:hypothetical protein
VKEEEVVVVVMMMMMMMGWHCTGFYRGFMSQLILFCNVLCCSLSEILHKRY